MRQGRHRLVVARVSDVRTQQARERVALALTWAPHRPGKGGFADGIAALDELADRVAALETALRDLAGHVCAGHPAAWKRRRKKAMDVLEGAAAEPETHK